MGGDATNWDEVAYRKALLKERETETQTVFRTIFAPSPNPNPDLIVVASSDGSISSYSISCCASSFPLGTSNNGRQRLFPAEPHCYIQGHYGPAYDVQFYGNDENCLLLSCGDDGRIQGWRWNEITNLDVPIHLQGTHVTPLLELKNLQQKGPWNSMSPIPENNSIAVDVQGGSIFAAAGDCCAYSWDVERGKIKMAFRGHSDYLHCVVFRSSSNQIITGSEDGTACIWDCTSGKCVQVINPKKDTKSKQSLHVSCIALDATESWLACGSGQSLSVFNLSACECVSTIAAPARVQDVSFDGNQIVAVGAQPVLSRYGINGAMLSQIQCAPQSAFTVSPHSSGVIAVAGYGGLVDVISQIGSHLCTFRSQCI